MQAIRLIILHILIPFLRSELNLTRQAMQEQSKNRIISEETYQSLIATNSDYADMITKTVGGYQMNTEAVEKYNDAQREAAKNSSPV